MDALKFLEECARMCDSFEECSSCPAQGQNSCYITGVLDSRNKEQLVAIVEKWAKENPVEPRQGELPDAFLRAQMDDTWIPVEELMPEKNKTVLVCQRRGAIGVAWHDGYRWKAGFSHAEWLCDVVAWRLMPEPYKAERSRNEKE